MLRIRKIDCYGQLILAMLILLSVPVFFLPGFLAGLFIIGCWQLISAGVNTYGFIHAGYKKQILFYWKLCIADFVLLFLYYWSGKVFNPDDMQVVFWIGISGSVFIAGFYLKIYYGLIEFISLRNELGGLIKSNHPS
jgi:hypothetical protein